MNDYSVYATTLACHLDLGDQVILYGEDGATPCTVYNIIDDGKVLWISAETEVSLDDFDDYRLSYDDEVDLWIST